MGVQTAFQRPFRTAVFVLGLAVASGVQTVETLAEPSHQMIVVEAAESRGLDHCLAEETSCGKSVADNLCRTRGKRASVAFGLAEDMTGATLDRKSSRLKPGTVIIDCGQ